MSQELEERARVVAEVQSWLRTPYHHHARVKGAGVDCGQLIAAAYEGASLVAPVDPGDYPPDWMLHRSEERFLAIVEQHARRRAADETPQPADVALFRFGRTISHGAIVVQWPRVIHAYLGIGVVEDDAMANAALQERYVGAWSIWPRAEALGG